MNLLETLYEVQSHLLKEQPQDGENTRKALDLIDSLIDEIRAEE